MAVEDFRKKVQEKVKGGRRSSGIKISILTRKFITFIVLLTTWVLLLISGMTAPDRLTYTENQLATERSFENESGSIEMTSQTYSKKNGIVLLEFTTYDATMSIKRGINADNLEWVLRSIGGSKSITMEVIPLTNNKIDIIIKGVPENFDLLSVAVTNHTVVNRTVNIEIQDYDTYIASSADEGKTSSESNESEEDDSNKTYFLVSPQSPVYKESYIKDLTREKFALTIFNDELKFQKEQVTRLNDSIASLNESINEDKDVLVQLKKEVQYLTGTELDEKQSEIEKVNQSIENKDNKIKKARDNIGIVQSTIKQLESNIKMVKDGTYEFNSPITSVSLEQEDLDEE